MVHKKGALQFNNITLSLSKVKLEDDQSSCSIVRGSKRAAEQNQMANSFWLSKKDKVAYMTLKEAGVDGLRYSEWKSKSGLSSSTFNHRRISLGKRGLVVHVKNIYRVSEKVQPPTKIPDFMDKIVPS